MKFTRSVLTILLILLVIPLVTLAASGQTSEEASLQAQIEQVLQEVDSSKFGSSVSTGEFIVRAYQLVDHRQPDAFEFYYCKLLVTQNHLTRSNLLALIMAGDDNQISWDKCRILMHAGPVNFFKNTSAIKRDVEKLQNAPKEQIIQHYREKLANQAVKTSAGNSPKLLSSSNGSLVSSAVSGANIPYDTYQTYFGYLHAHTSFSDGSGTPEEAYQYAREIGKLDFFAITDHGELIIFWPWNKKWDKIKAAADANNIPGSFVALWGFEWSNPLLGHMNIINTSDYTNCLTHFTLDGIYDWLQDRPSGFGTFNHPGDYDSLMMEFRHFDRTDSDAVAQMVGVETWNSSNGFSRYYYKNNWAGCDESYLDTGDQKGWLLGALGGQDNHDKSWGTKNQFRTAVLAKELTRDGIVEAYRARRFYATEDKDLYLDFRCSGYPMGSQISGVARHFTVTASDKSGDTFKAVRLYRNGALLDTQSVSGNSVNVDFADDSYRGNAYYYVIVQENDDNDGNGINDEAISSPIWVQ
jgi:hypothetical protein